MGTQWMFLFLFLLLLCQGGLCSKDIDECQTPGICRNGGTCLSTYGGGYRCMCTNGWDGDNCDHNIDDCATAVCFHGSTCIDKVASFMCLCPPGKTGLLCHQDDACLKNPCHPEATCETNPVSGRAMCLCPPGYTGATCYEDLDECSLGGLCSKDIDECQTQGICRNGGTCQNTYGGYRCVCANGWDGDNCDHNIDDCATAVCFHGSTCIDKVASFMCLCPPGKTGLLCHLDDACLKNPCHPEATCETNPVSGRAVCLCPPGYTGATCYEAKDECSLGGLCSKDIDECQTPGICRNGGTCQNTYGGYRCVCANGWDGDNCDHNIDDCATAVCFHGSTCIDKVASFMCLCPPGKTGLLCHLDDACLKNPCHPEATCMTNPVSGRAVCLCPPGDTGVTCYEAKDECSLGGLCTKDIDECQTPGICRNGGTCQNTYGGYRCVCANGWDGDNCDHNIDDCATAVCFQGSTCIDKVAGFMCQCLPGTTGLLCHLADACLKNPCHPEATCETNPVTGRAMCLCPPGYTGPTCYEDLDECSLGGLCSKDIEECQTQGICRNGGTCQNTYGGYRCVCANGWDGDNCDHNIDDCAIGACFQGSTCIDKVASFMCLCPPGKTGLLCHLDDACLKNPCHPKATCMTNPFSGKAICHCLPGYIGPTCSKDLDECSLGPSPCEHHGQCVNTMGSFLCRCPLGYTGTHCETDQNECHSNPCLNGASCLDMLGRFECECTPGFEGVLCERKIRRKVHSSVKLFSLIVSPRVSGLKM
ncbi:uncharacterized protein [Aquarana catesbeiana]|uniref:uncharacterized protein isoform X2 n=1 Tax=Aquarana catesbeiana TaxID=8400 RepID=UPI003CCA4325